MCSVKLLSILNMTKVGQLCVSLCVHKKIFDFQLFILGFALKRKVTHWIAAIMVQYNKYKQKKKKQINQIILIEQPKMSILSKTFFKIAQI